MATPQPQIQYQYVDRPDVAETYADSLEKIFFDGQTLRLEFCVNRLAEPQPPKPPTGRKYTACRLVLSPNGFLDVVTKLNGLFNHLKSTGAIKEELIVQPPHGTKPS